MSDSGLPKSQSENSSAAEEITPLLSPSAERTEPAVPRQALPEPGQVVASRYVILEVLGQGGMGVVLSAYDPRLDRSVALKLLHASDSPDHQLRLQREAQALARLSHPHVVTVYDTGSLEDGRLFLALERVEGQTLGSWCRQPERSWQQVLEAYVQAGRGLAAAHAAGLIHRDFKPSNVLMGKDGRVRVVDFGVVRMGSASDRTPTPVTPSQLLEDVFESQLTLPGQVVGTPRYLAPELLEGKPGDARSDLYAFCLSLYEALYHQLPFGGATIAERLKAMRLMKLQPLPAPTRVPAWVNRALLQGLQPEPARRPTSMEALLELLTHNPAHARLRRLGLAASLAAAAGLLAQGALAWQNRATERAMLCQGGPLRLVGVWDDNTQARLQRAFLSVGRPYAAEAWQRVRATLNAYAQGWQTMHRQACEATRLRGEQSEEVMTRRMACLDRRLDELGALVRVLSQADSALVQQAAQAAQQLTPLRGCADVQALLAEVPPPEDPKLQKAVEQLRKQLATVKALRLGGKYKQSAEEGQAAVERARDLDYAPALSEALLVQGQTLLHLRPKESAAPLFEASLLAHSWRQDRMALEACLYWLQVLFMTNDPEDVQRWLTWAEASLRRIGGDPWLEFLLQSNTEARYRRQGKYAQAREAFKRWAGVAQHAEGISPWQRSTFEAQMAQSLLAQGRVTEACQHARQAVGLAEQSLGRYSGSRANFLGFLVDCQLGVTLEGIQQHLEEAALIYREVMSPDSWHLGRWHFLAARVDLLKGRYEQAREHAQSALTRFQHHSLKQWEGHAARVLAQVLVRQGRLREARLALEQAQAATPLQAGREDARLYQAEWYQAQGQPAEALRLLEQALQAQLQILEEDSAWVGETRREQARSLLRLGRAPQAVEQARLAEQVLRMQYGDKALGVASTRLVLAEALLETARPAEAVGLLEQAVAVLLTEQVDPNLLAHGRFLLARALAESHQRPERVALLLDQAREAYARAPWPDKASWQQLERWASLHPAP